MPGYMPMGSTGMGEMGAMEMPLPDNTLPMMTGFAQFGPVEMGGMFSVVKVREGLAADDYKDPGLVQAPARHGRLRVHRGRCRRRPAPGKQASVKNDGEFAAVDPRKKAAEERPRSTDEQGEAHMKDTCLAGVLAIAAAGRAGLAAFAGAGPPGITTAPRPSASPAIRSSRRAIVEVVMKEGDGTMVFVPEPDRGEEGEQIRFKLRNDGELDHEIVLATLEMNLKHAKEMEKNPDMEHDDPNAKRVAAEEDVGDPLALRQGRHVRFLVPDPRSPRSRHERHRHRQVSRSIP